MKILFDQGTPAPLREALIPHEVSTLFEMGWSTLENGDLLATAEPQFEVFITTDKNLQYQQNLTARKLAILVLPTTRWPYIRKHLPMITAAVAKLKPNDYIELQF